LACFGGRHRQRAETVRAHDTPRRSRPAARGCPLSPSPPGQFRTSTPRRPEPPPANSSGPRGSPRLLRRTRHQEAAPPGSREGPEGQWFARWETWPSHWGFPIRPTVVGRSALGRTTTRRRATSPSGPFAERSASPRRPPADERRGPGIPASAEPAAKPDRPTRGRLMARAQAVRASQAPSFRGILRLRPSADPRPRPAPAMITAPRPPGAAASPPPSPDRGPGDVHRPRRPAARPSRPPIRAGGVPTESPAIGRPVELPSCLGCAAAKTSSSEGRPSAGAAKN